jgi:hypothetical protein
MAAPDQQQIAVHVPYPQVGILHLDARVPLESMMMEPMHFVWTVPINVAAVLSPLRTVPNVILLQVGQLLPCVHVKVISTKMDRMFYVKNAPTNVMDAADLPQIVLIAQPQQKEE